MTKDWGKIKKHLSSGAVEFIKLQKPDNITVSNIDSDILSKLGFNLFYPKLIHENNYYLDMYCFYLQDFFLFSTCNYIIKKGEVLSKGLSIANSIKKIVFDETDFIFGIINVSKKIIPEINMISCNINVFLTDVNESYLDISEMHNVTRKQIVDSHKQLYNKYALTDRKNIKINLNKGQRPVRVSKN